MLSLSKLEMRQEPYPIGLAKDVFESKLYDELVDCFPDFIDKFVKFSGGNEKYSLSQVNNPDFYFGFIELHSHWRKFFKWIKSPEFTSYVITTLRYREVAIVDDEKYTSRFEFSVLPANGGCLRPHTDIPSKVVTLVIPMVREGEWDKSWGGGTDALVPKDGAKLLQDYKADFSEFYKFWTAEYEPNQALVFIKGPNSWHSVGPIQGPAGVFRRTLTINIERAKA